MKVNVESYGHAVILNLEGEVCEDDLGPLNQAVEHQLVGPEVVDIVLNFECVPFIDSLGLEYLLDLQDRLAERFGQVKLVHVDENVATILEVTRLRSSFETFDNVAEAVKTLKV